MKWIFKMSLLTVLLWQSGAHASPLIEIIAANEGLYYNFGSVRVRTSAIVDLQITNTGTDPMTFASMQIFGSAYAAGSNCPDVLEAGDACIVRNRFSPPFEKYYSGALYVEFTNGDTIRMDMRGRGVNY